MIPPLVAIPGILEDADSWALALAPLGRPVAVLANHGDTIAEMAQSLLARAPQRFVLLGHSLGGYVALQAALAAPERVAGLVLVSTSARSEADASRQARGELVAAAQADFPGVVVRLARAALAREHRARLLGQVEAMMLAGGAERFAREQQAAAGRSGAADRLGEIACPTLVLTGPEDLVIDPQASREIAAGVPGARLVELPGCGHMPHLEAPEAFARELGDWLSRLR